MTSTPSRCRAMMTSLPSSPAPSSMTRVAEGESGVPRRIPGSSRTKSAILPWLLQVALDRKRLQHAQQAALERRGVGLDVEGARHALVDVGPLQPSLDLPVDGLDDEPR